MRSNEYVYEDHTVYVIFKGSLTSAFIWDNDGVQACGNAKQHTDDDYSEAVGEDLAIARAYTRYFRKLEKLLVKATT